MRSRTICTIMLLGLFAGGAFATPLEILVPAYFYPTLGPYWGWMTADASRVPITAILNPASGPGQFVDPNYTTVVNDLRAAGGKVLGYVTSSYATRDLASVEAEVETYAAFYAIDGIFVDEMANDPGQAHIDWYAGLYTFIKSHHPTYRIVGNPGTTTQEAYLSTPTVDGLVTYENYQDYRGYVPDSWVYGYPSDRFAHIPYRVAAADTMRAYIDLAVRRNVGMIFVTDADLPNPYDRLPGYWEDEVAFVEALRAADVPDPTEWSRVRLELTVSPNPFRDEFVVALRSDPGAGPSTNLWVADAQGRVVERLDAGVLSSRNLSGWRASRGSGCNFAPGIYFLVARTPTATLSRKILRLP